VRVRVCVCVRVRVRVHLPLRVRVRVRVHVRVRVRVCPQSYYIFTTFFFFAGCGGLLRHWRTGISSQM
jgi:hypothetical protein